MLALSSFGIKGSQRVNRSHVASQEYRVELRRAAIYAYSGLATILVNERAQRSLLYKASRRSRSGEVFVTKSD
jgi:hypothetical protein